jgi:glycosyltransferase involved in cell wall biosynthesis
MIEVPVVSIIVPCYNYGAFLPDALDSILNQSLQEWECIIVDDGSSDNTKEVGLAFEMKDGRFKYVYQKNAGLSSARNTGLSMSKGSYIQLLDADDMLEPEKLRLQVDLFKKNPKLDLIYSDILLFFGHEKNITRPFAMDVPPISGQGEVLLKQLVVDNFFLPGCPLCRKELFRKTGTFHVGLQALEDWHYWFRAALLNFSFYHDTREGARLLARSHGDNMSGSRRRMWEAKIKAREDIMKITGDWQKSGRIHFPLKYIKYLNSLHKRILYRDKARFDIFFGDVLKGIGYTLQHAFYSKKLIFPFYDTAYWIKERIKLA